MTDHTRGKGGFPEDAEAIWRAALAAVDPWNLVRAGVDRRGDVIRVQDREYDLSAYERVFIISFGKAGAAMGEALAEILDERLTSGLVVVPWPVGQEASRLEYLEAAHPVPDARSVEAARRVIEVAERAGEKDLLFVCISGGGSSLLTLPAESVALDKKRRLTEDLLRAGATINELNVVRKHLSGIKGGQLARAAYPATVVTLAISDVVGDDLGTIASGPTHWDASTFADARSILECYGLWDGASALVRARIEDGQAGRVPETLKEGDPVFGRVATLVVGDNMTALRAAKHEAEKRGFEAIFLSSSDSGEARRTAAGYAAFVTELACSASSLPRPLCLLAGGELTVTVKGRGRGGRNTEFVLAAIVDLDKAGISGLDWLILSLGTDGIDGPTDAAGAWADPKTIRTARALGLNPADYLEDNDSYGFFKQTGNLIVTGPTGTNVMDLRLFLLRAA
ncbi:MAG TPA: glycerate kinase [Candidatus Aminicenantes bacterium]|nr:glycerate kinase [Candidatus Aminicenantes bacterium]